MMDGRYGVAKTESVVVDRHGRQGIGDEVRGHIRAHQNHVAFPVEQARRTLNLGL